MSLGYTYRISQYLPEEWDVRGGVRRDPLWRSDRGPVEAAHVDAVARFAAEVGADRFAIREPHVYFSGLNPDEVPLGGESCFAQIFGPRLAGLVDGAVVDLHGAQLIVQMLLRGSVDGWCRLETDDRMSVHVWDQSVYIGTSGPCPAAVAASAAAGLHVCEVPWSPMDPDRPDAFFIWETLEPADEAFWADVHELIRRWGPVMLREEAAWTRWHRLTIDHPRVDVRARSRLSIERDLPELDMTEVRAGVPDVEGIGWLTWVRSDGTALQCCIEGDQVPDLDQLLGDAVRADWQAVTEMDAEIALLEAVVPDSDGVIRARWQ